TNIRSASWMHLGERESISQGSEPMDLNQSFWRPLPKLWPRETIRPVKFAILWGKQQACPVRCRLIGQRRSFPVSCGPARPRAISDSERKRSGNSSTQGSCRICSFRVKTALSLSIAATWTNLSIATRSARSETLDKRTKRLVQSGYEVDN